MIEIHNIILFGILKFISCSLKNSVPNGPLLPLIVAMLGPIIDASQLVHRQGERGSETETGRRLNCFEGEDLAFAYAISSLIPLART